MSESATETAATETAPVEKINLRNQTTILDHVEKSSLREKPLQFEIGDTVNVHTRIREGEDKEGKAVYRIQIFNGVVIARRGRGTRENFTVRRIVAGEGVERTFPVNSSRIEKIDIVRQGRVRRAKLFYLRDRLGKATRLSERRPSERRKKEKEKSGE